MSMEVFFNRPGTESNIKNQLLHDIENAKDRILGAIYRIDDLELINEIMWNKNVKEKKLITNHMSCFIQYQCCESNRYICDVNELNDQYDIGILEIVFLNGKITEIENNGEYLQDEQDSEANNAQNSKYINMHHKFIIIDNILWIGSYNFTNNAAHFNWENFLRISVDTSNENDILQFYLNEFKNMYVFSRCLKSKPNVKKYNITYLKNKCYCTKNHELKDLTKHSTLIYNICDEATYDEDIELACSIQDANEVVCNEDILTSIPNCYCKECKSRIVGDSIGIIRYHQNHHYNDSYFCLSCMYDKLAMM